MTTDPKKSVASTSISELAKSDVDQLLQTGLADVSLRELLGLLISSAGAAERNVYLGKTNSDKPNGFYDRSLQVGTIPVEVRVPRTRTGEFRPASLPSRYRRGYSDEIQSLLLGLLVSPAFATLGVDVSSSVSGSDWSCLKSNGYTFAITRGWHSSGSLDTTACPNVKAAHGSGIQYVDVYLFPCTSCSASGSSQVSSMVSGLKSAGCTATSGTQGTSNYGMVWLDIEGPGTYWGSNTGTNQNFFKSLLTGCSNTGSVCGVYTSSSQWDPIMGSSYTGGSSKPLWYPHYDNSASFSDFVPFGGWTKPAMKQYEGDVTVCGVGIDKDYY